VHLLLAGRARVYYLTSDGKQPILYFVDADELVVEQAILTGAAGSEYVETIEPTSVVSFPTRELRELMLSEPVFATGISELIARRRLKAERRIRNLLFLSNRERLTHLLLDLAEQYGTVAGDRIDLQVRLAHQDLANFIGSTRETVTVVLGKMQADGLLSVRRRKIMLLNVTSMAASVDRKLSARLFVAETPIQAARA
jgi:CRP-like cAMP-binding protein